MRLFKSIEDLKKKYKFTKKLNSDYSCIICAKRIEDNKRFIAKILLNKCKRTRRYNMLEALIPTIIQDNVGVCKPDDILINDRCIIIIYERAVRDWHSMFGKWDADQLLKNFKQIVMGCQKLLQVDYVHFDLKPENILEFSDNDHRISDFGHIRRKKRSSNEEYGTHFAAPPELQYSFGYFEREKADVYALGLILYEMHCGRSAIGKEDGYAIIDCKSIKDTRIRRIVLATTRKNPETRISICELLSLLHNI